METLELYLSPLDANAKRFKAIVTHSPAGEGETECLLPFFEDETDWRMTLFRTLEMSAFKSEYFPGDGELDWMVKSGILNKGKTTFENNFRANIGKALYQALFRSGSKVERALQQALRVSEGKNTQLHLRLKFEADSVRRSRLADYPWELLHDGERFLAHQQVTLSRYIAHDTTSPNLPPVERVNVLLVSSTAFDSERGFNKLSARERAAIHEGLKRAGEAGHICLAELEYATRHKLRTYLTENRGKDGPHVLHFDGHGLFGKRCSTSDCRTIHKGISAKVCDKCHTELPLPQGYLLFEDERGEPDYVSAEELGVLLRQSSFGDGANQYSGVSLTVLSACQSAMAVVGDSVFSGTAQNLIGHRIPAVVAMQYSVSVDAATLFAEQFYRSLGQKNSLAVAISQGREAMGVEGNQWYRPVLYLRWKDNQGGQLFATSEPATPQGIDAGVSQPGTLPPPDAGLKNLPAITQKPAFSLNVNELKWMPFDTGTVWGLERGSFIGILAGCQEDGVYENLISVERELFYAINNGNLSLPTRWWIRIDPWRYPNGPHQAAEVWDSAVEPDNPKVQWLKTQGLPDSIIPGIFFDINFQDLRQTTDVIQRWCEALIQKIFPDRQLATVINLKGMDKSLKDELSNLYKHLSDRLSGILIEAMILKDWYTVRYKEGTVERAQDEPLAAPKPVGFHFCSWVYKASAGRKELGRREEQEKYRSVIANYQKLRSQFSDALPVSSALKVVSDLDEIARSGDNTIYRQFLEFIENYLPGRLYELVSAYPESSSRQARREALIFARSHEDIISDLLMDAWVEGSQFKPDRFPQGNELRPLPGNEPFVNDLTWAILRQARKSGKLQGVDSLIQNMSPAIPQPVINFCLGKQEATEELFLEKAKELEIIEAAIRGGAELKRALNKFQTYGLRRGVFAKLLAAMPPSPEGLVKLNKQQRAVFGLCVAQELEEIQGDTEIFEKILDSRRGRMLGYKS